MTDGWIMDAVQDYWDAQAERDERFREMNDRLWGEGNWIRCGICPPDHEGNEPYHHIDSHP